MLNTVVEALESEASLTASLRQETSFFGRRLTGSGKYWQVRNASTLWRIEMTMREDQRQALFMQLSDSQTVWTYQRAADQQTLRKINLAQVNEFLKKESAVRAPETVGMLSWGLGGLPQLIAGINAAFAFGPPHQTEWKGQRVWRIEGGWRKETLVRLLPDQKDKILRGESANLSKLPEQIPNQVVVYIGAANLFPARIEYVRRDEPKAYEIWKSSRPHELTSIEFFDLQCGLPIDSRRFAWQAGNLDATDATETYLANLTPLADAMRDARRAIQGK